MSDSEDTEINTINSNNATKSNPQKDNLRHKESINSNEETVPKKTIEIISDLFNNICEESLQKAENLSKKIRPFMTKTIPSITIKDYLLKLSQHTKINESTITLVLIYIDRICNFNNICLSYYNIYKLILASMLTSIKYNEDYFYSTEVYAKLGGVSPHELIYLEYEFLKLINFSLYVEQDLFDKYNNDLLSFQSDDEEGEEN